MAHLARRLVACLLNISEGQNREVVERVANAAVFDSHGSRHEGTAVLNIFRDHDYNRSVLTIVASLEKIREPVLAACEQAFALIDMRDHKGIHPCMGAVDLLPLYPLGEDVGLEECGREAVALGEQMTRRIPGTCSFFFGTADGPLCRGLSQRRKQIGWFRKTPLLSSIQPDVGETPASRYGMTAVGSSPYVMNCNVTLHTTDLGVGRKVAQALRESSPGGLAGVQVLALPHGGTVEICCNVEGVPGAGPTEDWLSYRMGGQLYCHVPAGLIQATVTRLSAEHGVCVDRSVLVGFTPQQCRELAEYAITQGVAEYWRGQHGTHM